MADDSFPNPNSTGAQWRMLLRIEANVGHSPSSEKKSTGRRLVQSTLFPQKSSEKKDVTVDGVVEGREVEEEDGCCGSQGRRKRKVTPVSKPTSQLQKFVQFLNMSKCFAEEGLQLIPITTLDRLKWKRKRIRRRLRRGVLTGTSIWAKMLFIAMNIDLELKLVSTTMYEDEFSMCTI